MRVCGLGDLTGRGPVNTRWPGPRDRGAVIAGDATSTSAVRAWVQQPLATPGLTQPASRSSERLAKAGGESGIRTHGRVSPTHAFQACSFNHSDISPCL